MAQKKNNSFSLTLFDIYRKDPDGPLPEPPTFLWTDRDGASWQIPFLEPDETGGKAVQSALHRLYCLAGQVFKEDQVFRTAPQKLLNELNTTWQVGPDLLPVCFPRAGGFCLEKEYLLLYLEVQPVMPEINAECLSRLAVMLTNKLCYREKQVATLQREFKAHQEGSPGRSEQEIVQAHFQGNDAKLIKGITGEAITVREIFADLAGPGWESMLLDRFLLKSLLITPSEDAAPSYSRADEENLLRLTRGMNENYLPASLEALAGHVVPVQTFANVRFFAANEGIAAHVKPGPGPGQDFLCTEFSSRTHSEYMLLFVLAVYQHYRLIDLIRELARCTADLNEHSLDSRRIEQLRQLRQKLAVHEVKYINTQPAFLTNYQQYYSGLRQGLNTGALAEKLRRSVAELDALLAAEEMRRAEEDLRDRKEQKERDEKGKMLMAVTAEAVALPYYLHSLLAHALHFNNYVALAITGIVTVGVVTKTVLTMRGKKS
ncbi:hypothetical protein GCAAIG_02085 [Candidatus Electronema halotolerans]